VQLFLLSAALMPTLLYAFTSSIPHTPLPNLSLEVIVSLHIYRI